MTEATIVADSVGAHGIRLTTLEVVYPHYIHKEVMTHRAFSRNFMSMRAVPPEAIIQQVMDNPVIPRFHGRVKGMGTSGPLGTREAALARCQWLQARDAAVQSARGMILNDVAKSDVNPLLEPFLWMRGIITATDWSNFFALRLDEGARKEMQALALVMRNAMEMSDPRVLEPGEWHLPYVTDEEQQQAESMLRQDWPTVSAGRLARISFDNAHKHEGRTASIKRGEMLIGSGHWSPFEHPAICLERMQSHGNFRGWMQARKLYANESDFSRRTQKAPQSEA